MDFLGMEVNQAQLISSGSLLLHIAMIVFKHKYKDKTKG